MFKEVKELFSLLTAEQKRSYMKLQLLVFIMAIAELVGISTIGPFMALVGDISLVEKNEIFSLVYKFIGFSNPYDFLFLLGVGVLASLFISSLISMFTTWRLALFAFRVGTEIADRLYAYYLKQNWLFHTTNSSAFLIKQVSTESTRVTAQVILPLMHMNARIGLVLCISIALLIYNPIISVFGVAIFFCAYILLFKIVRGRLGLNGTKISSASEERFRLMSEGFGGVKDIILLGKEKYFVERFEASGLELAKASGINNALTYAPRYLMELMAFGTMILLVLFLIKSSQGSLSVVLPILGIYGLAGFKMLPALQNIYAGVSEIKGNLPAFLSIKDDLIKSAKISNTDETPVNSHNDSNFKDTIELNNVVFTYPEKNGPVLNELSMKIERNRTIGIVGFSGAGKSTLIDLLLGLIVVSSGSIKIGNEILDKNNIKEWQKNVGFVPQQIFLSENSIAENIAFGVDAKEIDLLKLNNAIRLSKLDEFVDQLEDGMWTKVGERGVQLSGGQRQRIGIARALYNEASVLIFDEATSSLDGLTEKMIMESINSFQGNKTIILVAHRLKTIENCDEIFFLENGKIRSSGKYADLIQHDLKFKEMTKHS